MLAAKKRRTRRQPCTVGKAYLGCHPQGDRADNALTMEGEVVGEGRAVPTPHSASGKQTRQRQASRVPAATSPAASAELLGKCLELIREVVPAAQRIAILANEADPLSRPFVDQAGQSARALGMEADTVMVRPETPLQSAFETMEARAAAALIVQGSLQSKELF